MKEINAGATLSIKMALPDTDKFTHFENIDGGFYMGFKETVPDDMTDEECDARALTMMERARKMCEEKVDADIHNMKDVRVFANIKKG